METGLPLGGKTSKTGTHRRDVCNYHLARYRAEEILGNEVMKSWELFWCFGSRHQECT